MIGDERVLTVLERSVLEKLLEGDHPVLTALRAQIDACRVISREFTGVGFFANLEIDRPAVPAPVSRPLHVCDVGAEIPGLEHGAGFVLFVTGGYMDSLEGFTYGEPWPQRIDRFSLQYERGRVEDPGAVDLPRC